jgi:HK97 family phage prohead protease
MIIRKTHVSQTKGLEFVLSDASIDRYGDIIEPNGWDLTKFNRNPICLFSHDANFPIGRWENLSVKNGELRGHLHLAPATASPRIAEISALIEANVLRSTSVGFMAIEKTPLKSGGMRYTKSELVEVSIVSVPANSNALAVAERRGVSLETQQLVFKTTTENISVAERIRSTRRAIAKIKHMLLVEDRPKYRATLLKSLQLLQDAEREYTAPLLPTNRELAQRKEMERRMEEAAQRLEVTKIVHQEKQSAAYQGRKRTAENIAAYTKTSLELEAQYQRSKPKISDNREGYWRGQNVKKNVWRGVEIPTPRWSWRRDDDE